jgi:hypothetical protein
MKRWAETWGILAGPHIRSLSISALSHMQAEGIVLISMGSQTNAASYTEKKYNRPLEKSEVSAVALKAFSSQEPNITAAKRLTKFFDGIETVMLDRRLVEFQKTKAGMC